MSVASIALILGAVAPSMESMAVDADGNRLALRSGQWTTAVYERRGDGWAPLAAGKVAAHLTGFAFVGDHFVVEDTVRDLHDGRIADGGTSIEALAGKSLRAPAVVAGDLAFFSTEPFAFGGPILQATDDGLKRVASISPVEVHGVSATEILAFAGTRLVRVDPNSATGCKVHIVERGDGAWSDHETLRPEDCQPGGDDFVPVMPRAAAIGVALDDDRLALGTQPFGEIAAGEVILFRRGKDGWKQEDRIARPTFDDDDAGDGFVPHGFGHRIVLQGSRMFVGGAWAKPIDGGYSTVYNGVFVMAERDGQWELEKHYIHSVRHAWFGADFEVRGNRLFVDSPLEYAVYVFEHRDGQWQRVGRVPPEPPADSAGADADK